MNNLAPIVLFVYNRPWHTKQTLESLMKNELADKSRLYIYADGKNEYTTEGDKKRILEVRSLIREKQWCKEINIIEFNENKGLAPSIIQGVTEIVNRHKKVIVLEDDLVLSKGFLCYMNTALAVYADDAKAMHVSGYIYPVKNILPETFFYQAATCWGWGTWERAWKCFNANAEELLQLVEKKGISEFNLDGKYDFYSILKQNILFKNDSWASRWYASMYINNGLSLHPRKSLVHNIGNDGSGVHLFNNRVYDIRKLQINISVTKQTVEIDKTARKIIVNYFQNIKKTTLSERILQSIQRRGRNAFTKLLKLKPVLWYNIRSVDPISRKFGMDRGKSIDRYYIEQFLSNNKKYISGKVLEVSEPEYIKQFGQNVSQQTVITVDSVESPGVLVADLTEIKTLPDNTFDCFICTQTLNFIYDFKKAVLGIHYLLKKNGVALVTVAGLCQISCYDAERWGDYWRFTPMSTKKIFDEIFGENNVLVNYYGNSLSAIALIKGLASDELQKNELDYKDGDYPVIITVVAKKI